MPESRQMDFFIGSGGCLIVHLPSVNTSLSTGSFVFVGSHYRQGFHVCQKRLCFLWSRLQILVVAGCFFFVPTLVSLLSDKEKKQNAYLFALQDLSASPLPPFLPFPPAHNTNNGDTSKTNTAITGVFISYQCQEQNWQNMRKNTTGSGKERERERLFWRIGFNLRWRADS